MWKRKAELIYSGLGTLPILTEILYFFWLTVSSTSYLSPCLDRWKKPQLQNYSCNTIRIAERGNHSISLPWFHSPISITDHFYQAFCTVKCGKICGKQRCKSYLQGEKALSRASRRNLNICQIELLQNWNKPLIFQYPLTRYLPVHHTSLIYTSYTHKL